MGLGVFFSFFHFFIWIIKKLFSQVPLMVPSAASLPPPSCRVSPKGGPFHWMFTRVHSWGQGTLHPGGAGGLRAHDTCLQPTCAWLTNKFTHVHGAPFLWQGCGSKVWKPEAWETGWQTPKQTGPSKGASSDLKPGPFSILHGLRTLLWVPVYAKNSIHHSTW